MNYLPGREPRGNRSGHPGKRGMPPGWLLACVIDLDPVAVWVLEVKLFNTIYAIGNSHFITGPILVGDFIGSEFFNEIINRRNGEAEMGILLFWEGNGGA